MNKPKYLLINKHLKEKEDIKGYITDIKKHIEFYGINYKYDIIDESKDDYYVLTYNGKERSIKSDLYKGLSRFMLDTNKQMEFDFNVFS